MLKPITTEKAVRKIKNSFQEFLENILLNSGENKKCLNQ